MPTGTAALCPRSSWYRACAHEPMCTSVLFNITCEGVKWETAQMPLIRDVTPLRV